MISWDDLAKHQKTYPMTYKQCYRYSCLRHYFKLIRWTELVRSERIMLDGIRDSFYKGIPLTDRQYNAVRYYAIMTNGGKKPNNPVYVIENVYQPR